jgi:hypothetical protein
VSFVCDASAKELAIKNNGLLIAKGSANGPPAVKPGQGVLANLIVAS